MAGTALVLQLALSVQHDGIGMCRIPWPVYHNKMLSSALLVKVYTWTSLTGHLGGPGGVEGEETGPGSQT